MSQSISVSVLAALAMNNHFEKYRDDSYKCITRENATHYALKLSDSLKAKGICNLNILQGPDWLEVPIGQEKQVAQYFTTTKDYFELKNTECFMDAMHLVLPLIPLVVRQHSEEIDIKEFFCEAPKQTAIFYDPISLNEIEYDPALYKEAGPYPHLRYIGPGNVKPIIPRGITSIMHMYSGRQDLTVAPDIPLSVEDISHAFEGCTSLTVTPTLPDNISFAIGAFAGCTNLTTVTNLPESLNNATGMCMNCPNLKDVPTIPARVRTARSMLEGCTSLENPPEIPANRFPCTMRMFKGCTKLKHKAVVHSKDLDTPVEMYADCPLIQD